MTTSPSDRGGKKAATVAGLEATVASLQVQVQKLEGDLAFAREARSKAQARSLHLQTIVDGLFREVKNLAKYIRVGPAASERDAWVEIDKLFKKSQEK